MEWRADARHEWNAAEASHSCCARLVLPTRFETLRLRSAAFHSLALIALRSTSLRVTSLVEQHEGGSGVNAYFATTNFPMRPTRGGYTYMMTNKVKTVLYTGVTSDLYGRVVKHKEHAYAGGFSDKYNAEYLVWYQGFDSIMEAIAREKQLKGWTRAKKEVLINAMNPDWRDLFEDLEP